jgi:hypothetical protein
VIAGTLISADPFNVRVAHAQNSVVVARGVQTGTQVFGTGVGQEGTTTATVTLGTPVDSTKAFVHCSFSTSEGGPRTHPTCVLSNTQVTITIGVAVAVSAHTTVRWYVVEFEGAVKVQRGTANFAAGATEPGGALVSLTTPVDCAKSFVLLTERMNTTATNNDEQWQVNTTLTGSGGAAPRAACTSGTTSSLELFRGDSGVVLDVAWQVIQIEGITVQRGRSCIGDTVTCPLVGAGVTAGQSQNATISTINTAKSFVLTTQRGGTGIAGDEGDYRVRTDFSSTTQLRFVRNNTSTVAVRMMSLTWEVVSLNDTGRVERNAFGSPATIAASATAPASAPSFTTVSQARAVPFFSSSHGATAAGQHSSVMLTAAVNQTTLSLARSGTSNVETIAWQVVEFFGCNTDPTLCHVSVSALGGTTADSASVRISWWPVLYASGNQCFSATASPSTCNVMVVRATFAPGQTPTDIDTAWISNGTSYTPGVLTGGGACTPTNGNASNPCVVHDGALTSGAVATFATDCWSGVAPCGAPNLKNDGTTYVYRVFVRTGPVGSCVSAPCWTTLSTSLSQVSVQPKVRSAAGGMQWVYQATGGASLNSPIADTSNKLYTSNSNNKIFSVDTSTGAELSLPVATPGPALGYPAWWLPSTGGTQVVVGDQSGYVTSFDGTTGKRLWTRRIHTDPEDSTKGNIQAAVVVQDRVYSNQTWKDHYTNTYGYTGDVVFASTRNITPGTGPTANQNKRNKVYALRATDGSYLWTFDPNNAAGDCNPQYSMDIVAGTPWVDYLRNSLYLPSEDGPTAGQESLWILDTRGPTTPGGATSDCKGTLKNRFGAILDNDFTIWQSYDNSTFYFQTTNGLLHAYTTDTPAARIGASTVITSVVTGSPGFLIKGSVWQDYNKYLEGKTRLYFVTQNGGVWCVDDLGNTFSRCPVGEWPTNPIYQHSTGANGVATGATPLAGGMLLEPHLWFGGGDNGSDHFGLGTIFQLSTTNGALEKTFVADSTSTLGEISVAESADALLVGSTAGRIYRINLSGYYGSLP